MLEIITPLIYYGEEIHDYGMCSKTFAPYSRKYGYWRLISLQERKGYYRVRISNFGKSRQISWHVAVHETLNPEVPIPQEFEEVPKEDWEKTPISVKNAIQKASRHHYEVNHKNLNTLDYSAKNLEWLRDFENINHYTRNRHLKSIT